MQLITFLLLIVNIVWSVLLYNFEPTHVSNWNYLYNFGYGLNYLLAAGLSFSYLKKYTSARPALMFFGVGFLLFFIAQVIWVYYNVIANLPVPYPGPADFFWLLFYVMMGIGFFLLLANIKSTFSPANLLETIVSSGVIFLLLSSFLSLNNTQYGLPLLTQFLNYAYPLADAILISLSIVTLRTQTGHLHAYLLFFIFGFMSLAVGDTLFAYQTTLETYWNGNITDVAYSFAGFLLLLGAINLPRLLDSTHTHDLTPKTNLT